MDKKLMHNIFIFIYFCTVMMFTQISSIFKPFYALALCHYNAFAKRILN
jgi:hypothetical protein